MWAFLKRLLGFTGKPKVEQDSTFREPAITPEVSSEPVKGREVVIEVGFDKSKVLPKDVDVLKEIIEHKLEEEEKPKIPDLRLPEYRAKIQITPELIWKLFPAINRKIGRAQKNRQIEGFVYTYNTYANFFGIDTMEEVSHFLSQVAHESDQFNAFEEYASGRAYENRRDLGNVHRGDGAWFKGHGPIQTTGRSNHISAANDMAELPFLTEAERALFENKAIVKNPKLLADPVWGTLAAFIYWDQRELNTLALSEDSWVKIKFRGRWITCHPVEAVTRRVNGGMNGYKERLKYYNRILRNL